MTERSRWWFLQGMTKEQYALFQQEVAKLQVRAEEVKTLRAQGKMTVQALRRTK